MSQTAETRTNAAQVDYWAIRARAEQLRGAEMRRLAAGLGRRIAAAFAALSGRRAAGQAV